jgi:hypothetical protein
VTPLIVHVKLEESLLLLLHATTTPPTKKKSERPMEACIRERLPDQSCMLLISRNSSNPHLPYSRPRPDCL